MTYIGNKVEAMQTRLHTLAQGSEETGSKSLGRFRVQKTATFMGLALSKIGNVVEGALSLVLAIVMTLPSLTNKAYKNIKLIVAGGTPNNEATYAGNLFRNAFASLVALTPYSMTNVKATYNVAYAAAPTPVEDSK